MAFIDEFKKCLQENKDEFTPVIKLIADQSSESLEVISDEDFVFLKRVLEKVRNKKIDLSVWKRAEYNLNLVEKRSGKRKLHVNQQLGQQDFLEILKIAKEEGAEVVHLKSHRKPYFKKGNQLIQLLDQRSLNEKEMLERLANTLGGQQYATFKSSKSVFFSLSLPGVSRFKVFAYWENGTPAIIFKQIPVRIPTVAEISLPQNVLNCIEAEEGGLILFGGPAFSGKSTSAAALIEWLNHKYSWRVLCIEDPIEYLFKDNLASITQRELNSDFSNSIESLRHALRDGSDVVFLTEIINPETLDWALNAAESGHLIISSIAASSCSEALEKISSWYSKVERFAHFERLAKFMRCMLNQRLLSTTTGSQIAVFELMTVNPAISTMIRQNNWQPLKHYLESSKDSDNFSLGRELERLIKEGFFAEDSVLEQIPEYREFSSMRLRIEGDVI